MFPNFGAFNLNGKQIVVKPTFIVANWVDILLNLRVSLEQSIVTGTTYFVY